MSSSMAGWSGASTRTENSHYHLITPGLSSPTCSPIHTTACGSQHTRRTAHAAQRSAPASQPCQVSTRVCYQVLQVLSGIAEQNQRRCKWPMTCCVSQIVSDLSDLARLLGSSAAFNPVLIDRLENMLSSVLNLT